MYHFNSVLGFYGEIFRSLSYAILRGFQPCIRSVNFFEFPPLFELPRIFETPPLFDLSRIFETPRILEIPAIFDVFALFVVTSVLGRFGRFDSATLLQLLSVSVSRVAILP